MKKILGANGFLENKDAESDTFRTTLKSMSLTVVNFLSTPVRLSVVLGLNLAVFNNNERFCEL